MNRAKSFKKVLLIESDPVLRRLRAQVLERAGHTVATDVGTPEVIERCVPGAFDLVVLGTNGNSQAALDLCEEVRRRNPDQLLIMVSRANEYIPADACPDDLVNEGPEQLVTKVSEALQ